MSVHEAPPLALPKSTVAKMEAAMALGSFAIGTGEFAIMGLMPDIASNLQLSEPQVGHAISAYALGVMVGARHWRSWVPNCCASTCCCC